MDLTDFAFLDLPSYAERNREYDYHNEDTIPDLEGAWITMDIRRSNTKFSMPLGKCLGT